MNKPELMKAIAKSSNLTIKDVEKYFESFVKVLKETLRKGESIELIGFGAFLVVERSTRTARNFRTGESIEVPACKVVKFKAGKNLKEAIR